MLPSTVAQECESNIFFRHTLLKDKLGAKDNVEALALLRQYKDEGKSLTQKL